MLPRCGYLKPMGWSKPMANLFFPQLTSGALAQYPIRKTRYLRTIQNVLADGGVIHFPDSGSGRLMWDLLYQELSDADITALQAHFQACAGPVHKFTFIDPTDNMLSSSEDFTAAVWQRDQGLQVSSGISDPSGRNDAFTLTNTSQTLEEISQTLDVPANYNYCLSVYVSSAQPSTITLVRAGGASVLATQEFTIGPAWTRLVFSGRLNDSGTNLSIGVRLAAGQQINVYGPQLEAQIAPSRYRPTAQGGGVYSNAHFAIDSLIVQAEAPHLFSTSFSIETVI